MNQKDINVELTDVYKDEALMKTALYYWIGQIRIVRKNLLNEPNQGNHIDVSIDNFIIEQLNINLYSTSMIMTWQEWNALRLILKHLKM